MMTTMMMIVLSLAHLLVEEIKNRDYKAEDSINCLASQEPPLPLPPYKERNRKMNPEKLRF